MLSVFKIIKNVLFLSIGFIVSISINCANASSSSSPELEDDFHHVENTNYGALSLFPEKLTKKQVQSMFDKKRIQIERKLHVSYSGETLTIPVGDAVATDSFYNNVYPNMFQAVTGTASSYASRIKFIHAVEIKDKQLYGFYQYERPALYGVVHNYLVSPTTILFSLQLNLARDFKIHNMDKIEGPCKIFNMRESVLGQKDFISKESQLDPGNGLLPDACLYSIKSLDREFIRDTGCIERLAGNTKIWLMLLNQLKGRDLYGMQPDEREAHAEVLYQQLLAEKKFDANNMTLDHYETCLMELRAAIFEHLGFKEDDIPNVPREDLPAMIDGKIFFAVAEVAKI